MLNTRLIKAQEERNALHAKGASLLDDQTHGQENNSNLPGKDLKEDEERKMFNEYGIDKTTVQTLF